MADPQTRIAIQQAADAAAVQAASVAEYQLSDGTRVRRPTIGDLLDARDRLAAEQRAAEGGGLFIRTAYRRPS